MAKIMHPDSYHTNIKMEPFVGSSPLYTYLSYQGISTPIINTIISILASGRTINAHQNIFTQVMILIQPVWRDVDAL